MDTVQRAIDIVRNAARDKVMVTYGDPYGRWIKPRHVKLREDSGGLYVRLGKRGVCKKYLRDMSTARIADAALGVVTFHE